MIEKRGGKGVTSDHGQTMHQILYLRPFWEPTRTVVRLHWIYNLVRHYGHLTTLHREGESLRLRLDSAANPWIKYSAFLGRLYDRFWPVAHMTVIRATNDTWQERVTEEIRKADAVILNLSAIDPHTLPDDLTDFMRELSTFRFSITKAADSTDLTDTNIGPGLLWELAICKATGTLDKVIVLTTPSFYDFVQVSLATINPVVRATREAVSRFRGTPLESQFPSGSPELQVLCGMTDVYCTIQYTNMHTFETWMLLEMALQKRLDPQRNTPVVKRPHDPQVFQGVPPLPLRLPPDSALKHVRFTPIRSLPYLPAHEVVELSREEVDLLAPAYPKNCPSCGGEGKSLFFYQYGLIPDFSKAQTIFMKCQRCGGRHCQ